jgi:uncharacterized protein YeaO (DUF488 family)
MILSIYLKKLRNSEFIQFFTDLISIFKKFNPEEMGIKAQLDPLEKDIESIKSVHNTLKGSDISDEIKEIDVRRDDCITGIRTVVEGYTYHYEQSVREAAQALLTKIDSFGTSIAKQNYPTETTSLKGIIDSFNKEEKLKNALTTVNLTAWAAQMEKENNQFNQRYLDRIDETSKQTDDKIAALRKSTVEKYFTLREHVSSHATLNTNANFKTIIDQLNILIDKYNGIIKRRGGNGKGDNGNNIT